MMLAALLTTLAIVAQDQSALRAAPVDSATTQAMLWQGEVLEVRGQKGDFLQVYDHRLERAGYVRSWQARIISSSPQDAPSLLSVVRFLHDAPGQEALGIAYGAAYLNSAPAESIDAEIFDALGTFSERLARAASSSQSASSIVGGTAAPSSSAYNAAVIAHLDVATSYGVKFVSFDAGGRSQICYDGEAYRRVLALPASDENKARAALALTRNSCVDPSLTPAARAALDRWRIEALDRVPLANLAPVLKNRIHLARAGIEASLAFEAARRGEPAQSLSQASIDEIAAVSISDLSESDLAAFSDASIRVSATRLAALIVPSAPAKPVRATIVTMTGEPGQTCVLLIDPGHDAAHALARRCTYGIVWSASARTSPRADAVALAVEPTDGWRELWVFQKKGEEWIVDTIPPGTEGLQLGYLEFAGWVPGTKDVLLVRETLAEGRYKRSFEVMNIESLEVTKHADFPNSINAFYRWQDPVWKAQTLSLRDIH